MIQYWTTCAACVNLTKEFLSWRTAAKVVILQSLPLLTIVSRRNNMLHRCSTLMWLTMKINLLRYTVEKNKFTKIKSKSTKIKRKSTEMKSKSMEMKSKSMQMKSKYIKMKSESMQMKNKFTKVLNLLRYLIRITWSTHKADELLTSDIP